MNQINHNHLDPMRHGFMRLVVKRESYADGEGTISTLKCGHTSSGPASTDSDPYKPCLTCESEAITRSKGGKDAS